MRIDQACEVVLNKAPTPTFGSMTSQRSASHGCPVRWYEEGIPGQGRTTSRSVLLISWASSDPLSPVACEGVSLSVRRRARHEYDLSLEDMVTLGL